MVTEMGYGSSKLDYHSNQIFQRFGPNQYLNQCSEPSKTFDLVILLSGDANLNKITCCDLHKWSRRLLDQKSNKPTHKRT
jgi:hypothetical protein